MKKHAFAALLLTLMIAASAVFGGCDVLESAADRLTSSSSSAAKSSEAQSKSQKTSDAQSKTKNSSAAQSATEGSAPDSDGTYTMADVKNLKNTQNFAKNTLEHIFDGTINGKGKATGYHYSKITDSKGSIIDGTRSKLDENGVFTAKVKVKNKKKDGFSSFYPESWSPQQVVDAINEAYDDAMSDKSNPHGSLWIGYSGDLEINMYLDGSKKITTAYPIYEGD